MSSRLNQVLQELRGRILRGEIATGERITETAAAEMLGVSRTPVRLALSILEQEDLVEGEPNKGFRVREYSLADYEQTIAIRAELEGMAARLAAQRGLDEETVADLNEVLERTEAMLAEGQLTVKMLAEYGRLNFLFHERLARASGNRWLYRLLEREIPTRYRSGQAIFARSPEKAREAIATGHREHLTLLEVIGKGDSNRADFLMQEHVHMPHRFLTKLLDNPETEIKVTARDIAQVATRNIRS